MRKYIAAWLAFFLFSCACHAADYLPGANYFGAFTTENQNGNSGCAALDSKNVALGMRVNIVALANPQRLLKGTVTARASAECTRYFQASASPAFYNIAITDGKFEPQELGILVLPGVSLGQNKSGGVTAQLGQKLFRFFGCSSNEGIHMGVRSVTAENSVIWHDYLSLGIDVDPTCRKSDYAAFDALQKGLQHESGGRK